MSPTPPPNPLSNPQPPSKKRKLKPKPQPHILQQSTFRKPFYTTFHIALFSPSAPTNTADLDPLLVSQLLTQALSSYLGLMGAAIPIDILKIEGRDVWIRVGRQDARGVRAGLGSWAGKVAGGNVGWRVRGEGVGGVVVGDGEELFGG